MTESLKRQVKRIRDDIAPVNRSPPLRIAFNVSSIPVFPGETSEEVLERERKAGNTFIDKDGVEWFIVRGESR